MANQISRIVAKMDDLTLHQSFQRVIELVAPDGTVTDLIRAWSYNVGGVTSVEAKEVSDKGGLSGRYAFESGSLVLNTAAGRVGVNFNRSIVASPNSGRTPSANFDQFDITFGEKNPPFADADIVAAVMQGLFEDRSIPSTTGTNDTNLIAQQIKGFGSAHKQMLKQLNDQLGEIVQRRKELEEEHAATEEERKKAHDAAFEELEKEREALELESYKARRRNLQSIITQKTAVERRKEYLSPQARFFSMIVPAIAIGASAGGFYMAAQTVSQMGLNDKIIADVMAVVTAEGGDAASVEQGLQRSLSAPTLYLMVKSVLSSVLAVGGLLYAAGWFRRMYTKEVETSHEIDRFNYDILRANWIIESVLEVTKEHGGTVPSEWIDGVTRGLFDTGQSDASEDTEQLAMQALLGMSSSAKVGPDGITIDLNKQNLRNIVKAAERPE